ncbi:hypothetical protein ACFX2I_037399 [Malus domestica]
MNEVLLQPYFVDEIKVTVFQIHPSKSPGSDGMSPLFYQQFWHIVGSEMVEVVNKPQDMSQLRPISLCNVLYKIGAKVIAN